MNIKKLINGYLEENCYILMKERKALIIDPGSDYELIKAYIKSNNLNLIGVLITHYHFDHVLILKDLLKDYDLRVFDYKNKNERINLFDFNFTVIETKGHTSDSVSFYFKKENVLFTGDFLFKDTIGDYIDKDEEDMLNSIKLIKTFDENIRVYPGHGEDTTIGDEIKNNPYLKE